MKKGLAALLALMLVLSLAGCGKKDDPGDTGEDDAIPDAPIKLETLHVEFVKGERDVDDLLALKDMLPLVAAQRKKRRSRERRRHFRHERGRDGAGACGRQRGRRVSAAHGLL